MLSQKSFAAFNAPDELLSRVQNNISNALDPVLSTPLLDGVLVERLTIPASGKLVVPHGLRRPARGILLVLSSAAVAVPYALPGDQTAPIGAIVLTFSSGAGAVVSFWVF